jgi:hypothetical protein
LSFDGQGFELRPDTQMRGLAANRATEEQIETILSRWNHELLPGEPVHVIGRQGTISTVADLTCLDRFGRLHLVELKSTNPITAGDQELFQLVSYMVNRVTTEDQLIETFAQTIWYGHRSIAAGLGGLISRLHLGTTRGDDIGGDARHPERSEGLLTKAARLASERIGAEVSPALLMSLGASEMRRRFGLVHDGPLDNVGGHWTAFREKFLGADFELGGECVVWLMAPSVQPALTAARPLLERHVDLRLATLDVREVEPGRSWSINLGFPGGTPWVAVDRFEGALKAVAEAHRREFSELGSPEGLVRVKQSAHRTAKLPEGLVGWSGLAGPAEIQFKRVPDGVQWDWYSHWWTEGQALPFRDTVNGTGKILKRSDVPAVLPWSDEADNGGPEFQRLAAKLLRVAWQHLVDTGASKLDRWARFGGPVT